MPIQTTYSSTGNNLASLLEQVTGEQEIVTINRRGYDDAAIVSAAELFSFLEISSFAGK